MNPFDVWLPPKPVWSLPKHRAGSATGGPLDSEETARRSGLACRKMNNAALVNKGHGRPDDRRAGAGVPYGWMSPISDEDGEGRKRRHPTAPSTSAEVGKCAMLCYVDLRRAEAIPTYSTC
jgi:hypothetical protein